MPLGRGFKQLLDTFGAARAAEPVTDSTLEAMFAYQAEVEATGSFPRQRHDGPPAEA